MPQFVGLSSLFATWFARSSSSSPLLDSARLLILGSIIETGRRLSRWLIERFRLQYSMTAQFVEGDPAFEWVLHLLTEQGLWRRSREFRVNATNSQRKWGIRTRPTGSVKDNAEYVPTYELPQLFRWNGYWFEIKRANGAARMSAPANSFGTPISTGGSIFITIYSLDITVLSDFVEAARSSYLEVSKPDVIVHTSDMPHFNPNFNWSNVKRKVRRSLSSIILPEGVIESILKDAQEFLKMEDWYVARGIPHRRGYLLHGPPGSGKSSTIYALAGELNLEIYSLSLASGFIDDAFLQRAANSIPKRSIFLIEDIDCAFPRDDEENPLDFMQNMPGMPRAYSRGIRGRSPVTLSGLLNVIDGVGSDDGKLFFATTNYIDRLDSALIRPGRIDKKIQYSLATKAQAAALFMRFYEPPSTTPISITVTDEKSVAVSAGHGEKCNSNLIQLADDFSSSIAPDEFSTAELQGYLLSCKNQPEQACAGVLDWMVIERKERKERKEKEEVRKRKAQEKQSTMLKGQLAYAGQMRSMQMTGQPVLPTGDSISTDKLKNKHDPGTKDEKEKEGRREPSPSPAYEPRDEQLESKKVDGAKK
ncbi:P-loop containing nucleoside triphosphate hydrolase protein [Marasmius fiardii PR-910]|nr:P-loop containing nucleoside triphosphate hydrolase protein [Marasmius fiardii PR-910]